MKGPEPVKSEICVLGSVSATRLGIMKGTLEDGLPSPSSTRPVGDLSFMTKVLASLTSRPSTKVISFWPVESFAAQRLIEATQSSAVTGWPSCQKQPVAQSERMRELVGGDLVLADHLRLDLALLVGGEQRVVDHVAVIADDVGGGPDRIEDLEIGVHDGAQRLSPRARARQTALHP